MNSHNTFDGELGIDNFEVASPQDNIGDYFDYENFYPFNGEDSSEFLGDWFKRTFTTKEGRQRRARKRRARDERRDLKARAKYVDAKARETAARGIADTSGDVALAQALSSGGAAPTQPPAQGGGMSTTTMLMIGGGVLLVGVVAFMALRKK